MNTLRPDAVVPDTIRRAIASNGTSVESVASAADISAAELEAFLNGGDIELCKLADVGGFLCIPLPELFKGVNA